jgi:hypothetical protein
MVVKVAMGNMDVAVAVVVEVLLVRLVAKAVKAVTVL